MYHFHRLFQRIHWSPRPYVTFCDMPFFFNVISCWYVTQPQSWKTTSFQFCITVYSDWSYLHIVLSIYNLRIWYVMGTQPYVYLLLILFCLVILLLVIRAFFMEDLSLSVVVVAFPHNIFQTCWIIEFCYVMLTYWWHVFNDLLCTSPFPPICNINRISLSLKLIFVFFTWIFFKSA